MEKHWITNLEELSRVSRRALVAWGIPLGLAAVLDERSKAAFAAKSAEFDRRRADSYLIRFSGIEEEVNGDVYLTGGGSQLLEGPFSAVSKPTFAINGSFGSFFEDLQDVLTSAQLRTQKLQCLKLSHPLGN